MDYSGFLAQKKAGHMADIRGLAVDSGALNPQLFWFQKDIVWWTLHKGRSAIFADCGLGKTPMQLEWARHVCDVTRGSVLILAPLAVASQTKAEGEKFGIKVHVCRTQADVQPGINITNYEMLEHFAPSHFVGVVLDESSILKSYMGRTKRALVEAFAHTKYRLCCTATPAPNDHVEIGNHAEFLGIMPANEMLTRWFINDTTKAQTFRLKGHAERAFWDWVASWAVSLRRPSDLGYPDEGFALPPLELHEITVPVDRTQDSGDQLFRTPEMSATNIHREMKLTAPDRAARVAELVNYSTDFWAVWCNTNYEADELKRLIPDAIEVRGSDSPADKERKLGLFGSGEVRVLVTKPSIAGFGLNFQHCHKTAFVGLSYSFEQLYQAIRRTYRFGQQHRVDAYIITAETEGSVLAIIKRKMAAHEKMFGRMNRSASKLSLAEGLKLTMNTEIKPVHGDRYTMYLGDCCEAVKQIEDMSVGLSVFSPPFSSLYIYSDALQDMGNAANDDEFFEHFRYLIPEILRVTMPGRLCAVHCKQQMRYKGRDGATGIRDFRGDIIRHFIDLGWEYHSEVCIWKDPVREMRRTKAQGLLYKQLRKDSSLSRQGMAEYLVVFRRWPKTEEEQEMARAVSHTTEEFPLPIWQRLASPVWFDIRQTNVLNAQIARADKDEKHLAPLQLDVIERALHLWSNPGEVIYDPFAGVGSTGYVALKHGRRFVGSELKPSYFDIGVRNLEDALADDKQMTIFDVMTAEVSN